MYLLKILTADVMLLLLIKCCNIDGTIRCNRIVIEQGTSRKMVDEDVFSCVFESIHGVSAISAIQATDAKREIVNSLQEFCTHCAICSDKFPQALDAFWDDSTMNE